MATLQKYTLNNKPVWQGNLFKVNGVRSQKPTRFVIRSLTPKDASAMAALSHTIYSHLNVGEECFIHKRKKSYYTQVFKNPDIYFIGAFVGSKLVGMSYMRVCHDKQTFNNEIPGSPISFFNRNKKCQIATLGADSVSPEYRGNNLNQIMIGYRLNLAETLGCCDAVSIVDRNNHWNMPPYFNNGFKMFGTAIDPADGGEIALMHYNLTTPPQQQRKMGYPVQYNRFATIDKLLNHGFIGIDYNKETGTITFVPENHVVVSHTNDLILSVMRKLRGYQHV